MRLATICIDNFRRLKNVRIELDADKTIFVGANNSGKTSSTHALQLFLGKSREKFSIYDFHMKCWDEFENEIKKKNENPKYSLDFPKISLDLWFEIGPDDLHHVLEILPGLNWKTHPVGVRLEFAAKDPEEIFIKYSEAAIKSKEISKKTDSFHPWPISLKDYLTKKLNDEYSIFYYSLDRAHFDDNLKSKEDYKPQTLGSKEKSGGAILSTILRIDFLNAQRHLSDSSGSRDEDGARAENLSRRFTKLYKKNLPKLENDIAALKALADSENQLSAHFSAVFKPTLESLNKLGYPGFSNSNLVIKAALRPEHIMSQNAELHYEIDSSNPNYHMPDRYNGLGFKNLIYMIVEIMDYQTQWLAEETPALLHILAIEEPEAHLHSQLQQVFIGKILNVLRSSIPKETALGNQLIVTTHSPHIIYESGFKPIRYFKRTAVKSQASDVLNLSTFSSEHEGFLEQYMKLTHCDLFFADAAILVEGNVERMLLPTMIEKSVPELKSQYISTIEIGGAYAYKFKELLNFLGCTTLVITDLDSVSTKEPEQEDEDDKETLPDTASKSKCKASEPDSVTSNQTLIQWTPKKNKIADLLALNNEDKTINEAGKAQIRICYQTLQEVKWKDEKKKIAARTLEESFAHKNLEWVQKDENKNLRLKVTTKKEKTFDEIIEKVFRRVAGKNFDKASFALELLTIKDNKWTVPVYIEEGLNWLKTTLSSEEDNPTKSQALATSKKKVGKNASSN